MGIIFFVEIDPLSQNGSPISIKVDGNPYQIYAPVPGTPLDRMNWFIVNDRPIEVMIDEEFNNIETRWGTFQLQIIDRVGSSKITARRDGRVKAPIPGQISELMVGVGDIVIAGQPLMILEAMKMENEIRSPRRGRVIKLGVKLGQRVAVHELLIEIE